MKRFLLISAILLLPLAETRAGINPFRPYKPLSDIDYAQNLSLGKNTASINAL